MSLLDDARRLNQDEPIEQFEHGGRNYFVFCGRMVSQGHAPDCPMLSLPKIVAALEAATIIDREWEHHDDPLGLRAALTALRAALKGGIDVSA